MERRPVRRHVHLSRHAHLALSAALIIAATAGCSDGGEAATIALDGGVVIDVSDSGRISISDDGRPLLTLHERGPEAASFELLVTDLFGHFQQTRLEETRQAFGAYVGTQSRDGAAVVDYEGGTIAISPEGDNIRIRVTANSPHDSLAIPIACDDDGTFHGFGEQYNATEQRGEAFDLFVEEQGVGRTDPPDLLTPKGHAHTTYYPMPYYLDARGFGVLFETDFRTIVDLCASDAAVAWIEVESSEALEAVVFTGPTPAQVIEQLGAHVGRPAKPPEWAYGLWIGSQGGRDAVLAEVDALEAANIPVSAIWAQDWTGPRPNLIGSGVQYRWVADEEHYPDLGGMIDELHQRGYRFLAYVNPFVVTSLSDHFPEMDAQGWLIGDGSGNTLLHGSPAGGDASHPDLTNEAARDYVKSHLRAMVTDLGIDGWMADFGEWVPLDATHANGGDPVALHNRYPEAWHRLSREVMDEVRPDGDWAVFSRSGWTGQQAVAQIVWCGDQEATFDEADGLPTVVPCMLNLGLSGVPFVTHDIAGFSGGPSDKELYLRWIELGAFTPIMRTHEGNEKDANWSWEKDQETTDHLRRFAEIHAALAEDIMRWADEAAETSMPIVRHLMLVFPDDPDSRFVHDQFMLGDEILVAPVVSRGATTKDVYLPPGTWHHVWTGDVREGPATVTVDAPIGQPPVFVTSAAHALVGM